MANQLVCSLRTLSQERRALAASRAAGAVAAASGVDVSSPAVIAAVRSKSWSRTGVRLTTGFMDNPTAALRRGILRHLNMWSQRANVTFVHSETHPQVRIARLTGAQWGGYWSYLGTDILGIPEDEPTMNFEGFTMHTHASEFVRVVCHEAGHTLGFPHEHMRRELVARIDPEKAYDYFRRTEGWSRSDVDDQVLTPLSNVSLIGTPSDQTSIMCYQLPGAVTRDGQPIVGGTRINTTDHAFAARLYPKTAKAKKGARKEGTATARKRGTKRTASKKVAANRRVANKVVAKKRAAKKAVRKQTASRGAARRTTRRRET